MTAPGATVQNPTLDPTATLAHSYPVMLDLRRRQVLVVGGGSVARRKVGGLLTAGAVVTVVAPLIDPELRASAGPQLRIRSRAYERADLEGMRLVVTCTDDPAVNSTVAREADQRGIWVNSADDPVNCTFTLPAVTRRGALTVTASTGGASPALARWLRRRFETEFDDTWSTVLELLAEVRAEAKDLWGTSEVDGWDAALDGGLIELVRAGQLDAARSLVRQAIGVME